MKKGTLPRLAAACLLVCGLQAYAQDGGYWRAASRDAERITGDINISKSKVAIDLLEFPLAPIRSLKPAEVSAVFDADVNAGISGQLYRVSIPAEQRFQHKNTLCGSDQASWMVTYVTGRTLRVAFFSGDVPPVFTFEQISNSSTLCGTFAYGR